MMQHHGAWMLHFCHSAVIAISQSPLLGICCSSITVVATSVILLLDVLLVMLFGRVNVWKVFFSHQANVAAYHRRLGLCMAHQQYAVVDSKFTQSKLCSMCNKFEQCYWLKTWFRFTMWWFHIQFCNNTINVFDTSMYFASEISLTIPAEWGDWWNLLDSGSWEHSLTHWMICLLNLTVC